jgi:ankyrin repeat protein
MEKRKQRRIGCLLLFLVMVALPSFLIRRQLRQDRLSAQLIATLKEVPSHFEIDYDAEAEKIAQGRERLKQVTRRKEVQVARLLQEGADPNVRDFGTVKRSFWEEAKFLLKQMFKHSPATASLPRSALSIAVQADNTVMVTALLKAGANDVNAEIETTDGRNYRFPLVNYAANVGNLEIVKELCAREADIHKLNSQSEIILQSALEGSGRYDVPSNRDADVAWLLDHRRRTEIFHLLQAKGAKVEANSETGHALLFAAAGGDFLELTRELLAAGVPANARPEWVVYPPEFTALDYAVTIDDIALVKLLLQYGASTEDAHSEAAILYVKSPAVARLLLVHGADIHAICRRGKREGANALNFACINGDAKVISFLIEHGLDVNSTKEYSSPITEAAEYGGVEAVRLLLKHGAKVGPKSPGADALCMAIAESHFDSAKLILRYGAAVNSKEGSPLTEAANQDNFDMALELLKRGANVNAGKGEALLAACESCDEDLVDLLLQYGADPMVRASDGTTAIQIAEQNADPPEDANGIIALLKDYGAKR